MTRITQIIKEARDQGRLTALDYAHGIFENFIELHGDRNFRDDGAVIGGIGWLGDQAVTVVGFKKERIFRITSVETLVNPTLKVIEKLCV